MSRSQREALEAAFNVIYPEPYAVGMTQAWHDFSNLRDRFRRFLDAEAYTDAALMLVRGPNEYPDHLTFLIDCATQTSVYSGPVAYVWNDSGKHMGKGQTPALAICEAALRAKGPGHEQ